MYIVISIANCGVKYILVLDLEMYVHKHMNLLYICAVLRLPFTIPLVHSLKLPVEEDEYFNFQVLALECAGVYGMGTMTRHLIWKPLFPSWQHFTQSNNTACFKVFHFNS